jgi:hypothetical protein
MRVVSLIVPLAFAALRLFEARTSSRSSSPLQHDSPSQRSVKNAHRAAVRVEVQA